MPGVLNCLSLEPAPVVFDMRGDRVFLRQGEPGSEQLIALTVGQVRKLQKAVATAGKPISPATSKPAPKVARRSEEQTR